MITVELQLQIDSQQGHETVAWYIAGADPAGWVAEIASWDVQHSAVRLLVVPKSLEDRRPIGAVVTIEGDERPSSVSAHCVPFGRAGRRLLLPIDARLSPAVSDDELNDLLSVNCDYVWHPASGLTAFEVSDRHCLADFLEFTEPNRRNWDRAVPGTVLARRLTSLLPAYIPDLDSVIGGGREDIGSDGDQLSELPRSPQEPRPGMFNAVGRQGKRLAANFVQWITSRSSGGGAAALSSGSPSWIARLQSWSQRALQDHDDRLDAARNKEVSRLLSMLDKDPDMGLRYALPIGNAPGGAHRGIAQPSSRLGQRAPDFSLGSLGGGQAADYWDIGSDYQLELMKRYRELANREIRLGRHRRAAYIFAELLSDYSAAAAALAGGGHWREAAVLYKDRLKQPEEAAKCLETGGLWNEAIAIYVGLERHEKAGDLYSQLDQGDKARRHYRLAVDSHLSLGELLSGARLLEAKLREPDEAISVLSSGWPQGHQATQCLRELMKLLARLARHETASKRIAEFRKEHLANSSEVELVSILQEVANDYPDRNVQLAAADGARVHASRQLPLARDSEVNKMMFAISRLVPEDRLLGRDCRRFSVERRSLNAPLETPAKSEQRRVTLVRTLQAPTSVENWNAAVCLDKTIFMAGHVDGQLFIIRSSWNAMEFPGASWGIAPHLPETPVLLAGDQFASQSLVIHALGTETLVTPHDFEATAECPQPATAGSIGGMSPAALGLARSHDGTTWLVELRGDHPVLVGLGRHGEQLYTEALPIPESFAGLITPVPMVAYGECIYVGMGATLLKIDGARAAEQIEFEQPITSLSRSHAHTANRLIVTYDSGGTIYWDDLAGGKFEPFAQEIINPIAGLNRRGYLIAAGESAVQVYSTLGRRLKLLYEFDDGPPDPVAVLSAPRGDQFGIATRSGKVLVYELP